MKSDNKYFMASVELLSAKRLLDKFIADLEATSPSETPTIAYISGAIEHQLKALEHLYRAKGDR